MKNKTFIDQVDVLVRSGKGGDGAATFRREALVAFGGPDGGDGGRGGDVVLRASTHVNSLLSLYYDPKLFAEPGVPGSGGRCYGRRGKDLVVDVPCGTLVTDCETGLVVADITTPGQKVVVAKGGAGGFGNVHFKSSVNQAPTEHTAGGEAEEKRLRLELKTIADAGLLGFPNAGKSSYINRLLNAERVIVSDIPGTTRDSADVPFTIGEGPTARRYVLVDTAGMKRHTQMSKTSVDNFSLFRSEKAIEEADVVLLVMESELGPTKQDMRIAGKILDAHRACVVLMNKWDLATEKGMKEGEAIQVIRQMMPFLSFAPVVFCSAKSGYNVRRTVDAIDAVASSVQAKLSTGVLNRTIETATKKTLSPMIKGRRLKIYYGLQVSTNPQTIRLFVNDPKLVTPANLSFLDKNIRARFGLEGDPLRIFLKARTRKD